MGFSATSVGGDSRSSDSIGDLPSSISLPEYFSSNKNKKNMLIFIRRKSIRNYF